MRSENSLGIARKISLRQGVEVGSTLCEMNGCGQIQKIVSREEFRRRGIRPLYSVRKIGSVEL